MGISRGEEFGRAGFTTDHFTRAGASYSSPSFLGVLVSGCLFSAKMQQFGVVMIRGLQSSQDDGKDTNAKAASAWGWDLTRPPNSFFGNLLIKAASGDLRVLWRPYNRSCFLTKRIAPSSQL